MHEEARNMGELRGGDVEEVKPMGCLPHSPLANLGGEHWAAEDRRPERDGQEVGVLDVIFRLAPIDQQQNAEAAHDNRGQQHLEQREVAETELTFDDVGVRHPAAMQQPSESEAHRKGETCAAGDHRRAPVA